MQIFCSTAISLSRMLESVWWQGRLFIFRVFMFGSSCTALMRLARTPIPSGYCQLNCGCQSSGGFSGGWHLPKNWQKRELLVSGLSNYLLLMTWVLDPVCGALLCGVLVGLVGALDPSSELCIGLLLILRQDPWFEFLVIFDFFAPWYRRFFIQSQHTSL